MKCPVHIQTKQGLLEWDSIYDKYQFAKTQNLIEWFRQYCQAEAMKQEVSIIKFLEKTEYEIDKNDDLMVQWKQMADRQSLYQYFARIAK